MTKAKVESSHRPRLQHRVGDLYLSARADAHADRARRASDGHRAARPHVRAAHRNGLPLHRTAGRVEGHRPARGLRTLAALYREYRATRPHIVFHYTIKPNIYGSIAAKLARVQSVAVTTGLGYVFIQQSRAAQVAKKLYRFAFRFPREVWFLNRDDHEALSRRESARASGSRAASARRRRRSRGVRVSRRCPRARISCSC